MAGMFFRAGAPNAAARAGSWGAWRSFNHARTAGSRYVPPARELSSATAADTSRPRGPGDTTPGRIRAVESTRPPPAPPPPNTRYGAYTLVDRLAVGGMAEVFRALEPRPAGEPRMVVVKRMLPDIALQPGAHAMFAAEAELGQIIQHENVVDVLGFGTEDGQPYLALEYVRGLDLFRVSRWLTRTGQTVGVPLAVFIVRQLLAGLHAVHEAHSIDGEPLSIVHRDVSPSNVLLSIHGDVKLGDFGIAYAELREQLPHALVNARAKGKLGYLAPEQVTGLECDRRADVFGAGVIAAELLMGRPLFTGGSELAVLLAIRDARIHPFREHASRLPDGLGEVVESALAQDRNDRIGSAAALSEALAPHQTDEEVRLRRRLGELVATAMRVVDDDLVEPTPLTDEMELSREHATPGPAPVVDREADTGVAPTAGLGREERETLVPDADLGDVPTAEYEIQTTDGKRFGPWPYAQLVEALAIGRVGAEDSIRLKGQRQAQRIADVPILARHVPRGTLTPATRELEGAPEPDELVPLSHGGMITALAWTVVKRQTGLWLCELGGVRKEVYVENGVPEFVTSNLAGELLGEYLVSNGVITRGELDMALAVMPRFEGRLGDTLAALGLVEPVHLFQHIAAQVREKLLDLFLWEGGHAAFYDNVTSPPSAFPLGLDPWKILEEAARRRLSRGLEDERFVGMENARLARSPQSELDPSKLPGEVHAVYDALARPMTLSLLEQAFPDVTASGEHRVRRALVLLFHLHAVRWQ